MKNILLLLFTINTGLLLYGQTVPYFELPLYFEDSRGNRDTVVVGYDKNANAGILNPQFGEIEIKTPFDSVFEVRLISLSDWENRTTKRIIADIEGVETGCFASDAVEIIIQSKYPPVSLRYDSAKIPSLTGCPASMVMTPDWAYYLIVNLNYDDIILYCMKKMNVIVLDEKIIKNPPKFGYLSEILPVKGQGLQQLPGIFWNIGHSVGCHIVNIQSPEMKTNLRLSPNPAHDFLKIHLSQPVQEGVIADLSGRPILYFPGFSEGDKQISVRHLPSGFYYLILQTEDGRRITGRFVKD